MLVERPADPRRRDDGRDPRRPRRRRRVDGAERGHASTRPRVTKTALDPDAGPRDPRVVPPRRAAARALRPRDGAAARGRRDRPPPARHAHPRVHGARRRGRAERRLRPAHRRPPRQADVPRRGVGDGDRERRHGGRARRGRDDRRPRRLRAAHPGPLPLPRLARRADRGDRLEHRCGSRASTSCAAARTASGPSTSRSRASRRSPRRPAAT